MIIIIAYRVFLLKYVVLLFINKNHKWLNYFVLEENDTNDLPAISSEEELEHILNEKSEYDLRLS